MAKKQQLTQLKKDNKMSTDRVDVYIAVEHKNAEQTKQVFTDNKICFEDEYKDPTKANWFIAQP